MPSKSTFLKLFHALKQKDRHDDRLIITGDFERCLFDNLKPLQYDMGQNINILWKYTYLNPNGV